MNHMKKRILIYRWKSYNYEDIIATFQQLGYETEILWWDLTNYDADDAFANHLDAMLVKQESTYAFVFSVNYYGVISNVCSRRSVAYVSWNCDSPMISMYHRSVFNPCNYIFLFDFSTVQEFSQMGVEHVYHLPLAVNVGRLDALMKNSHASSCSYIADSVDTNGDAHVQLNVQDDITFVGNLYYKNSYDGLEASMSDHLRGYFEALMEAQRDLYGVNIIDRMLTPDILEELSEIYHFAPSSEDSFSNLGLAFSVTSLGFKIAQLQRKHILIELSKKHKVGLYSNNSMEDLIRVAYRGSVDYWTQMPQVFAKSRINLNMTIPNIRTGIPLRVWDVLGAGGFLLTNYQVELPMFFDLDSDLVCYYSEEDLCEKADYYLEHETERTRIAWSGYQRVRAEHTYEIRMGQMLEILHGEGI